jgi:RHS repeat-associated protein
MTVSSHGFGCTAFGGVSQTLAWDVLSNLTSVTAGTATTEYLYDAAGQRYAAISGNTATIFMGSWDASDPDTGDGLASDVSVTRYYSADGAQVASWSTGGNLTLTFGDVQGSAHVSVTTNAANEVVPTVNAYTPYGAQRAGTNVTGERGWLNQVADATGLTYLNARYYDPLLGRFLSPDPLMNPGDPRTLDPYRYADNNPVVYTDATGLSPSCGDMDSLSSTACYSGYIADHTSYSGALSASYRFKQQSAQAQLIYMKVHGTYGKYALRDGSGTAMRGYRDWVTASRTDPQFDTISQGEVWSNTITGTLDEYIVNDAKGCASNGGLECAIFFSNFVPGGKGLGIVKQVAKHADDLAFAEQVQSFLYRGVATHHPGYSDALQGVARPRGGPASALEHNMGDTRSEFTSWTTNLEVANGFAGNAVVLRVPATSVQSQVVRSADNFGEAEVLLRGPVRGAEVMR